MATNPLHVAVRSKSGEYRLGVGALDRRQSSGARRRLSTLERLTTSSYVGTALIQHRLICAVSVGRPQSPDTWFSAVARRDSAFSYLSRSGSASPDALFAKCRITWVIEKVRKLTGIRAAINRVAVVIMKP